MSSPLGQIDLPALRKHNCAVVLLYSDFYEQLFGRSHVDCQVQGEGSHRQRLVILVYCLQIPLVVRHFSRGEFFFNMFWHGFPAFPSESVQTISSGISIKIIKTYWDTRKQAHISHSYACASKSQELEQFHFNHLYRFSHLYHKSVSEVILPHYLIDLQEFTLNLLAHILKSLVLYYHWEDDEEIGWTNCWF